MSLRGILMGIFTFTAYSVHAVETTASREALNRFMYRTLGTLSCPYHDKVFSQQMTRFRLAADQSPLPEQLATDIMEEYVGSFCQKYFGRSQAGEINVLADCTREMKERYRPLIIGEPLREVPTQSPFQYMTDQDQGSVCVLSEEDALKTTSISSIPMIRAQNLQSDNEIAAEVANDLTGAMTGLAAPTAVCPPPAAQEPTKKRGFFGRIKDRFVQWREARRQKQDVSAVQTPWYRIPGARAPEKAPIPPRLPADTASARSSSVSPAPAPVVASGGTPMGNRIAAAMLALTPDYTLRKEGEDPVRAWPDEGKRCLKGVRVGTNNAFPGLGEKIRPPAKGGISHAIDAVDTLENAGFVRVNYPGSPETHPPGTYHVYALKEGGSGHIDVSARHPDGTPLLVSDFQAKRAPSQGAYRLVATFAPPDYHRPKPAVDLERMSFLRSHPIFSAMKSAPLIVFALIMGGEAYAVTPVTCSTQAEKKLEIELTDSLKRFSPHLNKKLDDVPSSEIDALAEKLLPMRQPVPMSCLRSRPKILRQALQLAGTACILDDYDSNLGFLLELEKEKSFSAEMKQIAPKLSDCITRFIKLEKLERKSGND